MGGCSNLRHYDPGFPAGWLLTIVTQVSTALSDHSGDRAETWNSPAAFHSSQPLTPWASAASIWSRTSAGPYSEYPSRGYVKSCNQGRIFFIVPGTHCCDRSNVYVTVSAGKSLGCPSTGIFPSSKCDG